MHFNSIRRGTVVVIRTTAGDVEGRALRKEGDTWILENNLIATPANVVRFAKPPTWRRWDGGATYWFPRRVGKVTTCEQDLGYVEKTVAGWGWHGRMIPGPYGSFADGVAPDRVRSTAGLGKALGPIPRTGGP